MTDEPSDRVDHDPKPHLTTRRAFVTAVGFSPLSLYALWAAYDAAPTSLTFGSEGDAMPGMAGMGHGSNGGGLTPDAFRELTYKFIEDNELPDGSVKPRRVTAVAVEEGHHKEAAATAESMSAGHNDQVRETEADHANMREDKPEDDADHGRESAEQTGKDRTHEEAEDRQHAMAADDGHEAEETPIEVYFMASRYGYDPDVLRLDLDVPYKFRIMAVDADHGASMNAVFGSRIIRCRARILTEITLTFHKPGDYLAYCTVYCGEGHDVMRSRIIVA